MKKNTVYEIALLNLCKKARVKSPLDLIDKKIAFSFHSSNNIEVKMFAKIRRVIISSDNGSLLIFLSSGVNYVLDYDGNEKEDWKYRRLNNNGEEWSYLVEPMIFKLKWWQI